MSIHASFGSRYGGCRMPNHATDQAQEYRRLRIDPLSTQQQLQPSEVETSACSIAIPHAIWTISSALPNGKRSYQDDATNHTRLDSPHESTQEKESKAEQKDATDSSSPRNTSTIPQTQSQRSRLYTHSPSTHSAQIQEAEREQEQETSKSHNTTTLLGHDCRQHTRKRRRATSAQIQKGDLFLLVSWKVCKAWETVRQDACVD